MAKNQVTGYGVGNAKITLAPVPIAALRNPTSTDIQYPSGQQWDNGSNSTVWFLSGVVAGAANWVIAGSGATGGVVSITGDTGGAEVPLAGNFNIKGTANQITVTGSANTETIHVPAVFIAPGSIASTTTIVAGSSVAATTTVTGGTGVTATTGNVTATAGQVNAGTTMTAGTGITSTTGNITATAGAVNAGTSMTATLGNITATNGNFVLGTAGNKIVSTSVGTTTAAGANSVGSVVLTNGTATVSTTAVTANSLIMIWRQTVGTTGAAGLGALSVGTITAATSFVINAWQPANATALQASDESVIGYMIIN